MIPVCLTISSNWPPFRLMKLFPWIKRALWHYCYISNTNILIEQNIYQDPFINVIPKRADYPTRFSTRKWTMKPIFKPKDVFLYK